MNKKVFIKQDGTIPVHRVIEELEKRGGKLTNVIDYDSTFEMLGLYYYIEPNDDIYIASDIISDEYTELLYNKDTDTFYENSPVLSNSSNTGKSCTIPFGAFDSELDAYELTIPDGYEAAIGDGKVIVKKKGKWEPKVGEEVWKVICGCGLYNLLFGAINVTWCEWMDGKSFVFKTEEECLAFCDKLNAAISPILEERRKEVEG